MGTYLRGDVLLAPLCISAGQGGKVRPVVVLGPGGKGEILVCPVSSSIPLDSPGFALSLEDFSIGGLDLLEVSYVLTGRICPIRIADVIGKKGRLTRDTIRELLPVV